ncbi:MAG: site-2 protease family protein [Chloroflexi bacterium]|nr:site-2 protease family protein [Chloroflexota bacterium]
MTVLLGILTFFVVLAALILVHELGHFTLAKLLGVRVEEFGLGFPPRLKVWRRGGTLYSLNAIPIGGFVRMLGENGERPEPDSFGAKEPWKRFLILVAGPAMNLLLAVAIFFAVFLIGTPRYLTVVTAVAPGSPAAAAGLRPGDRVLQADADTVTYSDQLQQVIYQRVGHIVHLTVRRGDHTFRADVLARSRHPATQGPMGIELTRSTTIAYGPVKSAGLALDEVRLMVASIPTVVQAVSQHGGGQVAGPIGIAQVTTHVVQDEPQQGLASVFRFVPFLSANLAVLNLLPIPALDGGRIVFVLVSWVRRRNLDPEVESLIHMVGMAALLLLIALISYQDLVRWITGGSF